MEGETVSGRHEGRSATGPHKLTGLAHAEAMCHFNLRLMRKGATYYGRYHSLDLVDAALRAFEERQMELDTWLQLHIQEEGQ